MSTPAALSPWRVIDLSDNVAGAYCTKLLAGFGADVIKIEHPVNGDSMREVGPFLQERPDPECSIPFIWFHTAKQSVALDLQSDPGSARCAN